VACRKKSWACHPGNSDQKKREKYPPFLLINRVAATRQLANQKKKRKNIPPLWLMEEAKKKKKNISPLALGIQGKPKKEENIPLSLELPAEELSVVGDASNFARNIYRSSMTNVTGDTSNFAHKIIVRL
jgi:hypothetical protein